MLHVCRQLPLTHAEKMPSNSGMQRAGRQSSLQATPASASKLGNITGKADLKPPSTDTAATQDAAAVPNAVTNYAVQDTAECSASTSQKPYHVCLRGIEFLDNLKNTEDLQPVALPLQLKLFARDPFVVSSRVLGHTGMPSETFAHLLLR